MQRDKGGRTIAGKLAQAGEYVGQADLLRGASDGAAHSKQGGDALTKLLQADG